MRLRVKLDVSDAALVEGMALVAFILKVLLI